MIINLAWSSMKLCIDEHTDIHFFWSTEFEYRSNKEEDPDVLRYFIRQVIGSDENNCLLTKDGGADDVDFTDNYIPLTRAIEALS